MRTVRLGKTDVQIPVVGFGTMGIGGFFKRETLHDSNYIRALEAAIANGMTLIDTAAVYGAGHCEELVGEAIAGKRDKVIISSKFSAEHAGYFAVLASVEASLRRLKTDYIDIYQPHWPNPAVPISESMRALEYLVESGKVRFIGLSNFTQSEMEKAISVLGENHVSCAQHEYNLGERFVEQQILPFCRDLGITFLAYSPLGAGKISDKNDEFAALDEIAHAHNATRAQIALAWLLRNQNLVVIPKALSFDHIEQNARAADILLTDRENEFIAKALAPKMREIPVLQVAVAGDNTRKVYQTKREALENEFNMRPSPEELAEQIKSGEMLKAVKVRPVQSNSVVKYQVVDGRSRYWAWVIAYDGDRPLPAIVVNE